MSPTRSAAQHVPSPNLGTSGRPTDRRVIRTKVRRPPTTLFFSPDAERPRRLLNVAVAFVGLTLTLPVMFVIAALIKLTSRGPVFYAQTRVGLDRRDPKVASLNHSRSQDLGGQPFRIYKFRTMATAAGNTDAQVWAAPEDPRVTLVGRFLRKYRLDELPQLWNVLRSDMNVVGPRPEQPRIFVELRGQIDGYQGRQRVRPGITGWAQINQHYDSCLDDVRRKVSYDLEYIARQSVAEDFRIMMRTLPVMLFKRGAW
jgi:lipopolysaccharide/colanic/teichoic acid biosynthesis glycosyltransferase